MNKLIEAKAKFLSSINYPIEKGHFGIKKATKALFIRVSILKTQSASSGRSMFSVDSNHIALMMPKEHASKTPNIQAKYHMVVSLVNGMRLI